MHTDTVVTKKVQEIPGVMLDIIRLCASLIVLVIHAYGQWYPPLSRIDQKDNLAHEAVIIFFVLSGLVIAYTTQVNNRGTRQYAKARLSRLYSMVLPAILLTAAIEVFIINYNPIVAESISRGFAPLRYVSSMMFMNEIWFFSTAPLLNGPLWSLSYEFWFYVIWGLWFFRHKSKYSWILIIAGVLIAGPKILLMMPIWIFGALAYLAPKIKINKNEGVFILAILIILLISIIYYVPPYPMIIGSTPLTWAAQFLTDWLTGLVIASIMYITLCWDIPKMQSPKNGILRKIADLTFPIYVFHYPLLRLWGASFGFSEGNLLECVVVSLMVLFLCTIIGFYLESRKNLWDSGINKILHYIK
jgi:peptidoglycan/LPS O-acetylase OafA/YrhL